MVANSGDLTLGNGIPLELTANETDDIAPGANVTFTVRDDEGNLVDGATVTVGEESGTTDSNGTVTLPVEYVNDGQVTATATADGPEGDGTYLDTSLDLTVRNPNALVYSDVSITPIETVVDEDVSINVTLTNNGNVDREYNAAVYANGEALDAGNVSGDLTGTIGASESTDLQLTAAFDRAGDLNVSVGDSEFDSAVRSTPTLIRVNRQTVELSVSANTSEVTEGETVRFDVTRESDGTPVNASLTVDGTQQWTGADGSANVTFEQAGDFTATATKPETSRETYVDDSTTVRVNAPANITVTDVQPLPTNLYTGDTLTALVTVENQGDLNDTVPVNFSFQGTPDNRTVSLNGSESQTLNFSAEATSAGEHDIVVNGDTFPVTVDRAIVVDSLSVPPTVTIGDDLVVTATVVNRGSTDRTRAIPFSVDSDQDSKEVDVNASSSKDVEFIWSSDGAAIGPKTVSVDDLDARTVTVERQSVGLEIATNVTATTTTGGPVAVYVNDSSGSPVDANVTVDGNRLETGQDGVVNYTFDEAGRYTVRATKADTSTETYDPASTGIRIRAPANVSITDAFLPSQQAYVGDDVEIGVAVENDGGVAGDLELVATNESGDEITRRTVSLSAGESRTVTLTTQFDAPTEDEQITVGSVSAGNLTVDPQSVVTEASLNASAMTTADVVRVSATVENRGSTTDDGITVSFGAGEQSATNGTGSIASGETVTVSETFSFGTNGDYDVNVSGPTNEFDVGTVTVAQNVTDLELTVDEPTVTTGEALEFEVNRTDDESLDTATITIDGTEYEVTDGTASIDDLDAGTYTAVVTKPEDEDGTSFNSDSVDVTVQAPADISVENAYRETTQAYTGDNVTIEAVVTNDGDLNGTTTVNLTADEGVKASEEIRVNGSEQKTITLNATFDSPGTRTLSVVDESGEETVAGDVEVDPQTAVTDYTVSSTSVTVDNTVTVNATVRNRGTTDDTDGLTVALNNATGEELENKTVDELGAGNVTYVEFTPTLDTVGTTELSVNDLQATSVLATERIVDLSVDVETENPTTEDDVVLNVTNSTGAPVEDATVTAGGVTLETNASGLANHTFTSAGTLSVSVTKDGPKTSYNPADATFTVYNPAEVTILGSTVTTGETVYAGDQVSVDVDLLNVGGVAGDRNVTLQVDGTTEDYSVESVDPGTRKTVTLSTQLNETGERVLDATHNETDVISRSTANVQKAATVANYTLNRTAVATGEPIRVQANVTNRGGIEDTVEVNLSVGGEQTETRSVTVADSETESENFTVSFEENGSSTVEINDLDPTTVSIALQQASLSLTTSTPTVSAGETVVFNVEDENGDAVENAVVAIGDQRVSTDQFGSATTSVRVNGTYTAVATKTTTDGVAYERDSVGVTVTDPLAVPDTADFGEADAAPNGGDEETLTVEIANDGGRPISLGSASIIGSNSSQFEVRQAPESVAAGESAEMILAYTPATRGEVSSTLRFRADTPRNPVRTVDLSGTGVAPGISVNESSLAFGNETAIGETATETVEIENTGNADLYVSSESMGDGFSRSLSGTTTIAPGDNETVDVTFSPDAPQEYGSQLRLSSNDPFSGTVTVGASGTGLGGELLVSPAPDDTGATDISLGSVTQGSSSTADVLIENTGTDDLAVTPVIANDDTNDFAIRNSSGSVNDSSITLASGASEFLTINVTPSTADSPTANITFNSADESPRIDVAATTLTPTAEVTPDPTSESLNFSGVAVGGSTTNATVIENTGDAALEVDTTDAIPSGSPFELVDSPGTITIQPEETRELPVRFSPTSPGEKNGILTVETNDPSNETIELQLRGDGERSSLTGSTGTVEYESIGEDVSSTATVTLTNDGTEELTGLRVDSKTGSGAGQFAVDSSTLPDSLDAGESTDVTIKFAPTEDGSHAATVTFAASGDVAGSSQFAVSLSGDAMPPDVSVDADTLQYGYVDIGGEDASESVTISNDEPGTNLTVESVSITGSDAAAFTASDAPSAGTDISGSGSETFDVEFNPTETGQQTATLTIETDDPDEDTIEVTLVGVGSAPSASVDPSAIGFGQVPIDSTSDSETIEITNDGGEALEISDLALVGPDSEQFNVTSGDDSDSAIVPGATRAVTVVATPTSTGDLTANLTVKSNAPADTNVTLTATGTAPDLSVTEDLDGAFGDVRTGSSERRSLTVTNDGNATLEIQRPTTSGSDAFSVVSGGATTLAPDESTTYAVAFAPDEQTDDFEGTFNLTSNDRDLTVDLNGSGVEGEASLDPSTYDFGDVQIDSATEETFSFTNDGDASLTITSVSVTGDDASAFSVSGLSTGTVGVDESETFSVEASPSVTGSASAQLEIQTSDSGTTTASLGATGVEQDIDLGTQSVTFDRTRLGTTTTATFTISNPGNAPLNVSDLTLAGTDSDQFEVVEPSVSGGSPLTIAPQNSREVTVEFAPPTDDVQEAKDGTAQTATLLVQSDDPDEGTLQVDLSGTGKTPELRVSSDAIRFGSTSIGDTSTRTLTIRNDVSATANVNLRAVAASGGIGNEFTVTDTGDDVLEPGESTTATVELTPQVPGPKYGSLNVITGDPRQPGKSVFLSNSETIVTVEYGSVDLSYENVESGLQPERTFRPYPDADAEVTGTQPYVQTSDDFELRIDGSSDAFGAEVNSKEYGAIRYVSATKSNISSSSLENNTFTFRVSKAKLADLDASKSDVELLRYDGTSYEPVSGGTTLESEEQTDYVYEATTDSFSQFAIVVDDPQPNLGVVSGSASLNTSSVTVNNPVALTVEVENTGAADGTADFDLTLDKTTEKTESVSVRAGDTREVTIEFTPASTGSFNVAFGGESAGTLDVTEAGDPDDSTDTTSPGSSSGSSGATTQPASVDVTVQDGTAEVSISGASADQPVTIEPGVTGEGDASPRLDSLTVGFSQDVESTSMSVSGSPGDTPPVNADQDLGYFNIEHEFTDEQVGDVTFDFTVDRDRLEERGVAPEDVVLYRYHDGSWDALETSQSGSSDGSVQFQATSPGLSVFAVSTAQAQQPAFSVTDANLESTEIATGDSVDVTATVENTGSSSGTFTANLTVDGEVVSQESVTVDAGSSETVTFSQTFESAGSYDISVSGTTAGTLTVTEETSPTTTTTQPDDEPEQDGINFALLGLLVLVIAVLIGVFVYWRREQ
ncbi:choice-of-anchor D domain-containing protein [Halobellus captivus]|uniref:choice-of-anchor D domain-containing protein n=1 Tax=Halobellus captivus TaxID=2592614 RepID=UPI001396BD7D|nr:choice-of-anchor D domain-containing protein [Halobellus captivus]